MTTKIKIRTSNFWICKNISLFRYKTPSRSKYKHFEKSENSKNQNLNKFIIINDQTGVITLGESPCVLYNIIWYRAVLYYYEYYVAYEPRTDDDEDPVRLSVASLVHKLYSMHKYISLRG